MARVGYDDESTPLVVTSSQSITDGATGTATGTSTMVERVANIVGAIVGFVTIMAIVGFLGDASGSIRSGKAALVLDNLGWDINVTMVDVALIKSMDYKPGTFCAESDMCGISIDQCASMINTKQKPPEDVCPSFNYQFCCGNLKKFCKCDAGDSASSSMAALVQTSTIDQDFGLLHTDVAKFGHNPTEIAIHIMKKLLGYDPDVFCEELDMCVRPKVKCGMLFDSKQWQRCCYDYDFGISCGYLEKYCKCTPYSPNYRDDDNIFYPGFSDDDDGNA